MPSPHCIKRAEYYAAYYTQHIQDSFNHWYTTYLWVGLASTLFATVAGCYIFYCLVKSRAGIYCYTVVSLQVANALPLFFIILYFTIYSYKKGGLPPQA